MALARLQSYVDQLSTWDDILTSSPQNFNIYSTMNPTLSGKYVTFIGHEEGAPTTFRLKAKSEDQAHQLKRAVDREIEFVKAKSDA